MARCADTVRLVEALPGYARELGVFARGGPVLVARAPGRLDVMGGIADYSGSLVLQMPLALATHAAVAPRADRRIRVASLGDCPRVCEIDLDPFLDAADDSYAECRRLLEGAGAEWAAYALGPVAVLSEEARIRPASGFDLLIASDVPEGAGVASSAAVEVACASAIVGVCGAEIDPLVLALCCQTAENRVVGAACGAMDQVTSACGEEGRLLRLLCQPAEVEGHVAIPEGLAVFGIDSGVRHAVVGDPYTDVRIGAFMGFRMLVEREGVDVWVEDGRAVFVHPRWGTYLANVKPSELDRLDGVLPEEVGGAEFLREYGGISDAVTRVAPGRNYGVRVATAHPIREHERVRTFAALLQGVGESGVAELLGELMYQSHESYSRCGLGSEATDELVGWVREAGVERGVFGAKITGGGSGGTVAVLARVEAEGVVREIAGRRGLRVFSGSSAGAGRVGVVRVEV